MGTGEQGTEGRTGPCKARVGQRPSLTLGIPGGEWDYINVKENSGKKREFNLR